MLLKVNFPSLRAALLRVYWEGGASINHFLLGENSFWELNLRAT